MSDIERFNYDCIRETDACFCLVGGDGGVGRRTAWLVRSLRRLYEHVPIYVGIPPSEDQSQPLPDSVTQLAIPFPLSNYRISIKAGTLVKVEERFNHETKIVLDSDTLVFDRLTLPDISSEIYLKPEDRRFHWGGLGRSAWRPIFSDLGVELPSHTIESTVDKREIRPYYQGGVFVINGVDIGKKLLQYERKIFDITDGDYFAEQVALAALAAEHELGELTEAQNYPLNLRFCAPRSVEIAHYNEERHLLKLVWQRRTLHEVGALKTLQERWSSPVRAFKWSKNVSHRVRERIRWRLREQSLDG